MGVRRPLAWHRGSVRLRTVVATTLALVPALLVVSVAGVLFQRYQLTAGVALIAEEQARTVATAIAESRVSTQAPLEASVGGESTLLQVVDQRGRVVDASPALRGHSALIKPEAPSETTRGRVSGLVEGEDNDYLVVAVPATDDLSVVAAQSLESVDSATASTIGLLAIGDPLLVLIVAALSYLLVGRALSPVESLRSQAAEITAADLSARLPRFESGDEIERLSQTLNEMLARLQNAADSQRRFVADASHELRSPIATIRTLHEVADAMSTEADWPSISHEVLAETDRLEHLVADLLLLARSSHASPARFEPLDLSALVREELGRARNVELKSDVPNGVIVAGHRDSLARAVRNLLDNAERHSRSSVDVRLTTEGASAVLRVSDDGSGVAPGDRERIFDRFVRLDEARARDEGGAGLGLAITRHLVVQHGGSVRLDDTAQAGAGGATFVIELPAR